MNERLRLLTLCLVLTTPLLSPPVGRADAPKADKEAPAAKTYEVEVTRDVAYFDGDGADPVKHKLDLYMPKDCKDFPVLFFVHGGAWMHGDKSEFGIYSALGKFYAKHGIGTVVTNYRLSPGVKHPEHIKDVARAFAWTQKNVKKYGGRADEIFVSGHSAGGHLVALLATDETYLKAEGLSIKDIAGVIPISGVYRVPEKGLSTVFGDDADVRKQAGPLSHVRAGLPPFRVLYAENELGELDKMAQEFTKALKAKEVPVDLLEIKKQNHITIILSASTENDPCATAILEFIAAQTKR